MIDLQRITPLKSHDLASHPNGPLRSLLTFHLAVSVDITCAVDPPAMLYDACMGAIPPMSRPRALARRGADYVPDYNCADINAKSPPPTEVSDGL